ncbi:hypothetical protein CB0940_10646 [Cercospora beticola]|uniref:Uncharacterized protein n=1 Tax=Cercospora beticola TaxID=122368 RepID=A0A2G5HUI5_CERBT|nr:hypothetical protein CB0940_10646 [Cercospora beticola]PIA96200.1 hypothetical protein CB0940_10646 [Cercospora beticola]WPB07374.1 hypothetical protein RHO25_012035 [Cercospora beticola]CAK1367355.1 unnamed protein product [Cercospora beticola]
MKIIFALSAILGLAMAFCSKDNCCFKDNVARDKHNGDALYCSDAVRKDCDADCCSTIPKFTPGRVTRAYYYGISC